MVVERLVSPEGIPWRRFEQSVESLKVGGHIFGEPESRRVLRVLERLDGVSEVKGQLVGDHHAAQLASLLIGFETELPESLTKKAERLRHALKNAGSRRAKASATER